MLRPFLDKSLSTLKGGLNTLEVASAQQRLKFLLMGGGGLLVSGLLWWMGSDSSPPPSTSSSAQEPVVYKGAASSVPREEVWTRRLEASVAQAEEHKKTIAQEFDIMKKQVELLSKTLTTFLEEKQAKEAVPEVTTTASGNPSSVLHGQGSGLGEGGVPPISTLGQVSLEGTDIKDDDLKTVDTIIPAGSFAQGMLIAGVVASTAVSASSNPQPVVIRLLDHGKASRGWTINLKNAYLIGACHGDLSSERAYCRLTTLSYTEPSGEVVEKDVEGWIVDHDGRYGLFGHVVDRSDEVARQALISGILSGMASFFHAKTDRSVYPVSPFGQTNALSTTDMIKEGASSGVGKALEKLADFAIKRAESMSPVIMIDPGRVVDIVFKKGVDRGNDSVYSRTIKEGVMQPRQELALMRAREDLKQLQYRGTQP